MVRYKFSALLQLLRLVIVVGQLARVTLSLGLLDLKSPVDAIVAAEASDGRGGVELVAACANRLVKVAVEPVGLAVTLDVPTGPGFDRQQCELIDDASRPGCVAYECDGERRPRLGLLKEAWNASTLDEAARDRRQAQRQPSARLVDNRNLALVLDARARRLVECSTGDFGGCRLRRLSDLTPVGCNHSRPVVPFGSASGLVVGNARCQSEPDSAAASNGTSSLYLMVSMENDPNDYLDKTDFPVFSVRHLLEPGTENPSRKQRLRAFQHKYPVEAANFDPALVNKDFHMRVLYSFRHKGYVYFLYTVTNKVLSQSCSSVVTSPGNEQQTSSTKVTKIMRTCDPSWPAAACKGAGSSSSSFERLESAAQNGNQALLAELILDCEDKSAGSGGGVRYHLLQSAYFHENVRQHRGAELDDRSRLFMVFNRSESLTPTSEPAASVVCSVSMKRLNDHLSGLLRKCLAGENNLVDLVNPYTNRNTWKAPCRCSLMVEYLRKSAGFSSEKTLRLDDRKLFCQNDYLSYMNVRHPLTLSALEHDFQAGFKGALSSAFTSIAAVDSDASSAAGNSSVVLAVATLNGQLVLATYDDRQNRARRYQQINLLASVPIASLSAPVFEAAAAVKLLPLDRSKTLRAERSLVASFDRYLFRVDLQECHKFNSCDTCLGHAAGPFCGWCVYEGKCLSKQACVARLAAARPALAASARDSVRAFWLNGLLGNDSCPSVVETRPSRFLNALAFSEDDDDARAGQDAESDQSRLFRLNIELPGEVEYFCALKADAAEMVSAAVEQGNSVRCDLLELRPRLRAAFSASRTGGSGQLFVDLPVQLVAKATETARVVAETSLRAFNCSQLDECSLCTDRLLLGNCLWCPRSFKCVDAISRRHYEHECPSDVDYDEQTRPGAADRICTSFGLNDSRRLELLYSASANLSSRHAQLPFVRNPHLAYSIKYICLFTTSRRLEMTATAGFTRAELIWRDGDSATRYFDCRYSPRSDSNLRADLAAQSVYLSVWSSKSGASESVPGRNQSWASFRAAWRPIKLADQDSASSGFLELGVVNCGLQAGSCGRCMTERLAGLGCRWCRASSRCVPLGDCPESDDYDADDPASTGFYCSNPTVTRTEPRCGPMLSGGTSLVISGENLGETAQDVRVRMSLTSPERQELRLDSIVVDCPLVRELYEKSSRIVCRTQAIPHLHVSFGKTSLLPFSVFVETNVRDSGRLPTYSSFNRSHEWLFSYVVPEVTAVEPLRGIRSGGTVLKVTGKHLNCGTSRAIFIGGRPCTIVDPPAATRRLGEVEFVPRTRVKERREVYKFDRLDEIYCRTPAANQSAPGARLVSFKMDDYELQLDEAAFGFEYVDDPKIATAEPNRTILSGGVEVVVRGKNFGHLQSARLVLRPMLAFYSSAHSSLTSLDQSLLYAANLDQKELVKSDCTIVNATVMTCLTPSVREATAKLSSSDSAYSLTYETAAPQPAYYQFRMFVQYDDDDDDDAVSMDETLGGQDVLAFPDPVFKEQQSFSFKNRIIVIEGDLFLSALAERDYAVWIGESGGAQCNITSITMTLIACVLPDLAAEPTSATATSLRRELARRSQNASAPSLVQVRVQAGRLLTRTVGFVRFDQDAARRLGADSVQLRYIVTSASLVCLGFLATIIGCFVVLKRRQNKQISQLKLMQTEFENLEIRVARECKEAFTELQMDIGELASTLNQVGVPFHDFPTYCTNILFPNAFDAEKAYLVGAVELPGTSSENVKNGLSMFSQLLLNKHFLLTFIHILESDTQSFLLQDRLNLASYISVCLHDRMDYLTDILTTLLSQLIEKIVNSKNNPKILLRRNESVAEKMLTNWFTFLLYDFIKECAGTSLYILFLSIKQQIYKGPVDALTCEARYSLSEDKLIRQSIDYEALTIRVKMADDEERMRESTLKVLNCDTVSQVKEKILDHFYKGLGFSKRPLAAELDLVYVPSELNKTSSSSLGRFVLYDEDKTCELDHAENVLRVNTLAHYKITNGSLFFLVPSRSGAHAGSAGVLEFAGAPEYAATTKFGGENTTLLSKSVRGSPSMSSANRIRSDPYYSNMNGSSIALTEAAISQSTNSSAGDKTRATGRHRSDVRGDGQNKGSCKIKRYHLIKPTEGTCSTTPDFKDASKSGKKKRGQVTAAKLVSEVYLTRLLATKGGMQSYIDDFFESVLSIAHGSNVLPFAIKYLFDFLDEQACLNSISDNDVVYTWKSNSLPLRFWVNIIKNPDFVFDVFKSNIVDASLSVIASTFMESCSSSRLDLNKESPSGKLLFYKEVHKYRKWVESYYSDIKSMPQLKEDEMNQMLNEESKKRQGVFNKSNALFNLYNDYVKRYRTQIENALLSDAQDPATASVNKHLNYRLQQIIYLLDTGADV